MHRICGLIHTDLKPENVSFTLKSKDRYEMYHKNVLKTNLIDLFEREDAIILDK